MAQTAVVSRIRCDVDPRVYLDELGGVDQRLVVAAVSVQVHPHVGRASADDVGAVFHIQSV